MVMARVSRAHSIRPARASAFSFSGFQGAKTSITVATSSGSKNLTAWVRSFVGRKGA
jgi:hypothetical protein